LPDTEKPLPDMTGPRLVYFAAGRTLLSWVRMALGLMAFGFEYYELPERRSTSSLVWRSRSIWSSRCESRSTSARSASP